MKVSVIVPIYNAERYLRRQLDSLKNQTLSDFEVIMIDDGSTDSSALICKEFADSDFRFRAIYKQNAGVSAARQDGLDAARGEYVIHADSDDWVEPDMLQELYVKAKEEDADVVICDFYNDDNKGNQTVRKQQPSSLLPLDILRELFQQLHGSCCNKLVRRVCYSNFNIRFPDGLNYCEDLYTWVQLFSHEDIKVAYLNKAFYHYVNNPSSITRNYKREQYETLCEFASRLESVLPNDLMSNIMSKLNLDIFTEAYSFDVLSLKEIKEGIKKNWKEISQNRKFKAKIMYLLIYIGLGDLIRKIVFHR